MTSHYINPLATGDYDQWQGFCQNYADFYYVASHEGGVQTTWSWLIDSGHVCAGLVAGEQGQAAGFAHFCGMLSLLRGQIIGFLNDLL